MEDTYRLTIGENDDNICLSLDPAVTKPHSTLDDCLKFWLRQKEKLAQGEITKEQYDEWRYKYPTLETLQQKKKFFSTTVKSSVTE